MTKPLFAAVFAPLRRLLLMTLGAVLPGVCLLVAIAAGTVWGEEAELAKHVKATLAFREDFDAARHYPRLLKVCLCLDNVHDADVTWIANGVSGVEAELLDGAGKPVPTGPSAASIPSNPAAYLLPFGSRLEWLLSHGGISMAGEAKDKLALIIGGRGWLIPADQAGTYSLALRLRGLPFAREAGPGSDAANPAAPARERLLLDLPATKIVVTRKENPKSE